MTTDALEQRLNHIARARERLGAITAAVTTTTPSGAPSTQVCQAGRAGNTVHGIVAGSLADFASEAVAQLDATVQRLRAMQAAAAGVPRSTAAAAPEPADVIDVKATFVPDTQGVATDDNATDGSK